MGANVKSDIRLINPSDNVIHLSGNKVLAIVSQVKKANIFTLDESESSKTSQENSPKIPNLLLIYRIQI